MSSGRKTTTSPVRRSPVPRHGELRAYRADFKLFFSRSTDGAMLVDSRSRRIITANVKLARMLGYSLPEMISMDLAALQPKTGVTPLSSLLSHQAICLGNTRRETRLRRKDGTVFAAEVSGSDLAVTPRSLRLILVRNVTRRKRIEDELKFSNALLTTQQKSTIDGILVVDRHARILSYNTRFIEMWGLPEALVRNRDDEPVLEFVSKQLADRASFVKQVQHLYRHKHETSRDELLLADGRVFDRYSAPMFSSHRHYYGRVWYFRDVSDRKRAEDKFTRAFNSSPVLTAISTLAGGRYLDVNESFLTTLGYTREEVIGRTSRELGITKDPQFRQHVVAQVRKHGFARNLEVTIYDKQHRVRWGTFSADQIVVGNEPCLLTTMLDITERKLASEELRKKNTELDRKVAQLRKLAMELSQAEDRERIRLATRLHDEVQQFLVAATMKISLLNDHTSSRTRTQAMKEALDILGEALTATRSLTTDLYPPVLLEGGLIPGLQWLATRMLMTLGLTVEVTGSAPHPISTPLITMLFQGIRELLFNVVKHSGVKAASVAISQPNARTVRVTVGDLGRGFPPGQRSTIKGMGLFLLRERLAYFGGTLEAVAHTGKGARLVITLPLG